MRIGRSFASALSVAFSVVFIGAFMFLIPSVLF
jgi:hypothetical protein